ncbi:MAG: T9SS type A sorting domain-containing protein [Chitinophagaceae bacterium]|nr:T9SS type A sorting domain-containing protein [Chitinophagaceae bacterium]
MKQILLFLTVLVFSKFGFSQTYCAPTFANGCFNWNNSAITLNTINWTAPASCTTWDFTTTSTTVTAGVAQAMSVTNGVYCGVSVWMDLNSDGDFDDLNENLYSIYTANANNIYNFNITVPAATPNGNYRLRVIGHWGSDGISSVNGSGGCGSYQYGNYQDFTLNVGGVPPPCLTSTGISTTAITTTTATISWNPVAGATAYEYVIDNSSSNPVSGTSTINTSYNATLLNPGTLYYVHVRTDCGSSNYSSWILDSFTTIALCNPPTGLSASAITSSSATVSWGASANALSYEYAVDNSVTPPATGTNIIATTTNATALNSSTMYYLHVRSNCGANNFSTWETIPFSTIAACEFPTNILVTNITDVSADINWNAILGAVNYEYVLDNSSANPSGAGTTVIPNSLSLSSLSPNTNYFFHLRSKCDTSNYSLWTFVDFTTQLPAGINSFEKVKNNFSIVQNLSNGTLKIVFNSHNALNSIKILNTFGTVLFNAKTTEKEFIIDVNRFSNGMYFIQCQNENAIEVKKCILFK